MHTNECATAAVQWEEVYDVANNFQFFLINIPGDKFNFNSQKWMINLNMKKRNMTTKLAIGNSITSCQIDWHEVWRRVHKIKNSYAKILIS